MKTRRPLSRRFVLAAAAFLAALSLNPTAALHAQAGTAAPPEVVCPANVFLPPLGFYSKAAGSPNIVWANGVQCRAFKIKLTVYDRVPPAAGSPPVVFSTDCTASLELSNNGGVTYQALTLPAVASVQIAASSTGQGRFDIEMLSLEVTGLGPLRIRESPTRQSLGQHTVRAVPDGSFRVSSFFDIFTEISLDGGQSWSPTPVAAPALHCVLDAPVECASASGMLPPVEGIIVAQSDLVFANGVILRDLRLRDPSNAIPPPPPGAPQIVVFTTHASGRISLDGGASLSGWVGDCSVTVRYTSRSESGSVRDWDMELMFLSLSGGSLPAGVMLRESPTKVSLGRTSLRLAQNGAFGVSCFFDVFTELSLNGGQNWSPSTGSACVCKCEPVGSEATPYVWPTDDPLPAGAYTETAVTPVGKTSPRIDFASSAIEISSFSWGLSQGGSVTSTSAGTRRGKTSEAEFNLSLDGGASSAIVHATVSSVVDLGLSGSDGERPMELIEFTCSGGTLPAGFMLRESPTKASLGRSHVGPHSEYFTVSDFFDVFLELSTDGGTTWTVANDPLRLTLAPSAAVETFDADCFPPRDGAFSQGGAPFFRPENDVTSYPGGGLPNVKIRDLRLQSFAASERPPVMPGVPQVQSTTCALVCEMSFDDGVSFFPVTAPSECVLRTTRKGGISTARHDTELLSLTARGGSLPPGAMIRESPTKQSLGRHRVAPTLLSDGRVRASSFFDIFTELSVDNGQTWQPCTAPTHLELSRAVTEVFSSSDWLPLAGPLECDDDDDTAACANGAVIRTVSISVTDDDVQDRVPPPAPGLDVTKVSAITLRGAQSLDGGATFSDITATGAITVRTRGGGGGGGAGGSSGDRTEMLQCDVSGGTLPPGFMLRESPTKQSLGSTTKRAVAGGYRISSFFDVFLEISLDGGANWSACDRPIHLERAASGQPRLVADNLLPPPGDFISPSGSLSLRCATGKHIAEAKGFPTGAAGRIAPPPPGVTVSGSRTFDFSFLYSDDDGASYRKNGALIAADYDYKELSRSAGSIVYGGEITDLHFSSSTFFPGTMLRESPTKQSTGRTVSRATTGGGFSVSSFFDIFLEITTDSGATWEPFDRALHLECDDALAFTVVGTDTFPPPSGSYRQRFTATGTYSDMTSVSRMKVRFPTLPGAELPALGASAEYTLAGTADCTFQPAGSAPVAATCPVQAEVILTHTFTDGADRFFDAEMLSFQLSGGSLPPGAMIRESPTKQSTGQHTVRVVSTGQRISSFFDVFTEVSLDGGASWSPCDGPIRLAFEIPPTAPSVAIGPVTARGARSATLQVTGSPGGSATAAQLRYGPTMNYGGAVEVLFSPNDGTAGQTLSVALTGLVPATTYHCVFTATNAVGTATTEDFTFTTFDTAIRIWKLAYLGDADAPLLGTPDNDGIATLVKYGLVLTPGSSSVDLLPQPLLRSYQGVKRLALIFLRDPRHSDLEIEVQFATSLLGPWTTVAACTGSAPFTGPGLVSELDAGPGLPGVKIVEVHDTSSVTINFAKISYKYSPQSED